MQVTEQPIGSRRRKTVSAWVLETQALVPELSTKRSPMEWVDFIDEVVRTWQSGSPPNFNGEVVLEDLHLLLGCLWGDQICKVHGWKWVTLNYEFPDGTCWSADSVVSPDRSFCINPYAHVLECAEDPELDACIAASIRVIGTSVIPKFPKCSFKNLMHGLRPIVPTRVPGQNRRRKKTATKKKRRKD